MKTDERSQFVSAPDGLQLHVRVYGEERDGRLPVVCLPGLSRNGSDFRELAEALSTASGAPRRVLCVDLRGRGLSEYDRNPANYSLPVELGDVIAILAALSAEPAVLVGTSRGGILAMLLAAFRPGAIAGAVLNDIGPVIETTGLMRIKGYVGKASPPASLEEGAELLRRRDGAQFTRLTMDDWLEQARRNWWVKDGKLVPSYDPALSATLEEADLDKPLPDLWAQFDALPDVPLMVIRGENSDLLSTATLEAMKTRRADLAILQIEGEGHAPRLEGSVIADISAFVDRCDRARP
jgi:pimeloyl-ACP methyl ester carboxylesterase